MKKFKYYILLLALITNTVIYAQFSDNLGNSSRLNSEKKTIPHNWHSCLPPALPKVWKFNNYDRRFTFRAHIYDNCAYTADELDSTNGWNKIGRIAFIRNSSANKFKMHLGWIFRDDPHKISFSMFFHDNDEGYFVAHKIDERGFPDANATVDMYLGSFVMGMIINNEYDIQNYEVKCIGIREDNSFLTVSGDSYVSKTFYFGGNSKAPHKMEMKFHDLYVDYKGYQSKFNSNDIMTWNLSEFNSPDNFKYYASDIINGSVEDKSYVQYHKDHPNKEYQKCIIHPKAQIEFHAGQAVHLYPGFHAMQGSYFIADNNLPPALTIKETPTSFAENIEYKTDNARSVEFALYYDDTRDSLVYSAQAYITDSLANIPVDTLLPNRTYYAVANFYSGKGSRKRIEGLVTNNNYGLKNQKAFGSDNNQVNNTVSVFPNPSGGTFNITVSHRNFIRSVKVTDINGQVLVNKQTADKPHTYTIDLSNKTKGIYILTVETITGIQTIRLVKY